MPSEAAARRGCVAKETIQEGRTAQRALDTHRVIGILLATVLLTAATMKAYHLATSPLMQNSLIASRWVLIALVEFEFVLALCLVGGLWRRLTWQVSILCFTVFACASAYKVWHGDLSCGCFGKAEVPPSYTLTLDLLFLIALVMCPPRNIKMRVQRWRGATVAVLGLFLCTSSALVMALARPAQLSTDGELIGKSPFVLLEPTQWVGGRFPLLRHIKISEDLAKGAWIIVLYDRSCPHCQLAMPKYRKITEELAGLDNSPRVALVEVPPYRSPELQPRGERPMWAHGRLDNVREWFLQAPVELFVVDGQVIFGVENGEGLIWINAVEQLKDLRLRISAEGHTSWIPSVDSAQQSAQHVLRFDREVTWKRI
ncbi:MAG TPA: MauE/DoxX family redox-associated membrane protein [Planctomycetota bacterium]